MHSKLLYISCFFLFQDFELYGCSIFVDFMKRKMNSYDWPYISIVVIDANNSPKYAIEGIACTERHASYVFAVKALLEISPGRTRKDILNLFSDCILDDKITSVGNMNLPNCKFWWDNYHLISEVWPKRFGNLWGGTLSLNIEGMLNASTREIFETHYSNLKMAFASSVPIMEKINEIVDNCNKYA